MGTKAEKVGTVSPGTLVRVVTAAGDTLTKRALTAPIMGDDFPVVWACSEDEWEAAAREAREPDGVPWPAEDVRLLVEGGDQ